MCDISLSDVTAPVFPGHGDDASCHDGTCRCAEVARCDFPQDVDEHGNLTHAECACPTDLVEKERRLRGGQR